MAKNHKTFESLESEILKRIKKRLEGPTGNIIKKELNKNAKKAEGPFSIPYGIGDMSNIESNVAVRANEVELEVYNVATPNIETPSGQIGSYDPARDPTSRIFTTWIEEGLWMELPIGSGNPRKARPFVEPTQKAVNTTLKPRIIEDIKKAFK